MAYRIRPQDITPTAPSLFMTVYAARVTVPLAEALESADLFLSVRERLRPGDFVDLCRFEHGDWNTARVLEFARVIVTQKGDGVVRFFSLGVVEIEPADPALAATPPADPLPALEVVPGDEGGFLVREVASGHVHGQHKTRKGADQYVADYGRKQAA